MIEIDNTDVVSAKIGNETYRTLLETTSHTVVSDEPISLGGKNLGPSPGDLLRMSLASCTAITLRMYANRKGWDVKNIEVSVGSKKVEQKTMFTVSIAIDGPIDPSQRQRMLQIGKLCPIHKILTGDIEVAVDLV
jgi:putative redox protein